nr:MAG TPA: hypothetical protein [Caudoviricetes sp.]
MSHLRTLMQFTVDRTERQDTALRKTRIGLLRMKITL